MVDGINRIKFELSICRRPSREIWYHVKFVRNRKNNFEDSNIIFYILLPNVNGYIKLDFALNIDVYAKDLSTIIIMEIIIDIIQVFRS